ncbi:MAG TPA: sulfotransferase, partial [Thiobacillus sp.]|nr:sulfotransferase [Thiobacillus sp.]
MLQFILDDLPDVCMPTGESHFIIPLFRNQQSFGGLDTHEGMRHLLQTLHNFNSIFLYGDLHGVKFDVDRLADEFLAEGRVTVRDVIAGIFEKNAAGLGKHRWGDKTPYYALHLDKLVAWWPDAKFIHLVRDGRDVALSLFGRQHDFSAYNVYYAAQYWQQYVDVCRTQGSQLPAGQYLEIRYEDVLNDKESAIRAVCDFIGEPCPDMLQQAGHVRSDAALKLKTVRTDNQGKWRRALNAWQIRVFESEAGTTLRQSGYPLLTSARRLPLPLR